jgi:hypothetical protein
MGEGPDVELWYPHQHEKGHRDQDLRGEGGPSAQPEEFAAPAGLQDEVLAQRRHELARLLRRPHFCGAMDYMG